MHVFIVYILIVYIHPHSGSFTACIRDAFISGLFGAGHTWEIAVLYALNFCTDMSEAEYLRESEYREDLPVPDDFLVEQGKINRCDAIVFIYPVFWTEAPAKLVGWFDRAWTIGFAYGTRRMHLLEKALFPVPQGTCLNVWNKPAVLLHCGRL